MEKLIRVMNQLRDEGIVTDYAIGGGAATLFYTEPFFTEDVDVFVHIKVESKLIDLSPIYERAVQLGAVVEGVYLVIGDAHAQIIVPPTQLEEEALQNAQEKTFGDSKVKAFSPEYLIAIYLRIGRSKDKLKVELLREQAEIDQMRLNAILKRHNLKLL
jgi:hypothetical protein